ncbi:MAG: hypothetical protein O7E52_09745, partial [Candidatus Poribacteria bacterium]|nr:hypothetical protein [Candidatus Poribacteria bacterium]
SATDFVPSAEFIPSTGSPRSTTGTPSGGQFIPNFEGQASFQSLTSKLIRSLPRKLVPNFEGLGTGGTGGTGSRGQVFLRSQSSTETNATLKRLRIWLWSLIGEKLR